MIEVFENIPILDDNSPKEDFKILILTHISKNYKSIIDNYSNNKESNIDLVFIIDSSYDQNEYLDISLKETILNMTNKEIIIDKIIKDYQSISLDCIFISPFSKFSYSQNEFSFKAKHLSSSDCISNINLLSKTMIKILTYDEISIDKKEAFQKIIQFSYKNLEKLNDEELFSFSSSFQIFFFYNIKYSYALSICSELQLNKLDKQDFNSFFHEYIINLSILLRNKLSNYLFLIVTIIDDETNDEDYDFNVKNGKVVEVNENDSENIIKKGYFYIKNRCKSKIYNDDSIELNHIEYCLNTYHPYFIMPIQKSNKFIKELRESCEVDFCYSLIEKGYFIKEVNIKNMI